MRKISGLIIYSTIFLGSIFIVLPLAGWLKNTAWTLGSWNMGNDPLGFLPTIGRLEVWVILLVAVINACWLFVVITTREGN